MCKSPPEFIMQQIILRLNLSITYLLKVNFRSIYLKLCLWQTLSGVSQTLRVVPQCLFSLLSTAEHKSTKNQDYTSQPPRQPVLLMTKFYKWGFQEPSLRESWCLLLAPSSLPLPPLFLLKQALPFGGWGPHSWVGWAVSGKKPAAWRLLEQKSLLQPWTAYLLT